MATASPMAAAPARVSPRLRATVAPLLPAGLVVAGVAVALRLLYAPSFLNYDAQYALLWARDAASGHLPEYGATFAPTPHPLQTAVGALALGFGDAAGTALTWAALLCFGALVWLVGRLGRELFGPWAGVAAAVVVATRPALERDALLGYQDVAFAALVVGAVLLEVRRRRRGIPVLAVLALAGLLRPEAWMLAGAYALHDARGRTWRERAARAGLVVLAPAVWALTDLAVTGDPLHSLHGTAALAAAVDRRRDIADAPYWTAKYLGFALREPAVLAVPLGLLLAWRRRRRAALVPVAAAALLLAVFALGPLAGLPLVGRYVRTPAILLAVFYGAALAGWVRLPPGPARARWRLVAGVALAATVAYLPWQALRLERLDRRLARTGADHADLRAAARAPAVDAAFAACPSLTTGDRSAVPFARYWVGGAPGSVATVEDGAAPAGRVVLLARRTAPPAGYRRVYANRSWRVYAAPGCVTRPRA